jgi:hypothetical protein
MLAFLLFFGIIHHSNSPFTNSVSRPARSPQAGFGFFQFATVDPGNPTPDRDIPSRTNVIIAVAIVISCSTAY